MHACHDIEAAKSGISLIRVQNEKELRLYNIDELARSLHGCSAERQYPIYLVFHHGHPVGYFHAVQQLVVYPAFHPEKMSPREFIKIVKSLATEFKRMTANPLFMLCGKALELGDKHMLKVRLKRAPETAFVYTEEED